MIILVDNAHDIIFSTTTGPELDRRMEHGAYGLKVTLALNID